VVARGENGECWPRANILFIWLSLRSIISRPTFQIYVHNGAAICIQSAWDLLSFQYWCLYGSATYTRWENCAPFIPCSYSHIFLLGLRSSHLPLLQKFPRSWIFGVEGNGVVSPIAARAVAWSQDGNQDTDSRFVGIRSVEGGVGLKAWVLLLVYSLLVS
jgi:hypothetical protein